MEKCLQATLIDYMIQSKKVSNEKEACKIIDQCDFSAQKNLIRAGLKSLAEAINVTEGSLLVEEAESISKLSAVSDRKIINALNSIHDQWIIDNLTPILWVENYFEKQTFKYRKIQFLPFDEVTKYLIFINRYLMSAYRKVNLKSLEKEFGIWCKKHKEDDREKIHDFITNPNFEVTAMKEIFKLKVRLETKCEQRNVPRKEQEIASIKLNAIANFLNSKEIGLVTARSICPEIADFLIEKMYYQFMG